jgi:hypothetical protein
VQTHPHLAVFTRGVYRILNEMSDHALYSVFVPSSDYLLLQFELGDRRLTMFSALNSSHNVGNIHCTRRFDGGRALPQLHHHLLHAVDGMRYRHEHVLLEVRIILVTLGILEHQRKLGYEVFEVMYDECRHAVKRIELAGLELGLGSLHMAQEARRLAAGRFQEIVDLPIELHAGARRGEYNESHQLIRAREWHDEPRI